MTLSASWRYKGRFSMSTRKSSGVVLYRSNARSGSLQIVTQRIALDAGCYDVECVVEIQGAVFDVYSEKQWRGLVPEQCSIWIVADRDATDSLGRGLL